MDMELFECVYISVSAYSKAVYMCFCPIHVSCVIVVKIIWTKLERKYNNTQ